MFYFKNMRMMFLILFISSTFAKNFHLNKIINQDEVKPLKHFAVLTVGDWLFSVEDNGQLANYYNSSGGIFPKNTSNLINVQGILWGAWIKDPRTMRKVSEDSLRVGGCFYRSGLQPGWIQENGKAVDVNDPRVKIYFVRKDWKSMTKQELKQDAAYVFDLDTVAVTEDMMQAVKDALAENWKNWPVDLGAPYNDVNRNGVYDPVLDEAGYPDPNKGDYPGIAQADQVIWFVANDLDKNKTLSLSGVAPIGIELQVTLWTYKGQFTPLSKSIFIRYRIINKSPYFLDSMYVSIVSNPDIGYYGDDLVGCDPLHNMWFAYNGSEQDKEYARYGIIPPVLGYSLLAGPQASVPQILLEADRSFANDSLLLSSFFAFYSGSGLGYPNMGTIGFTNGWYNIMRGYLPSTYVNDNRFAIAGSGPFRGEATRYPFSGDPIDDPGGIWGDVDGAGDNTGPGSREMAGNMGPFNLAPKKAQEIILAVSGGMGNTNRNGIEDLRSINALLHYFNENQFNTLRFRPLVPKVRVSSLGNVAVLDWGNDPNYFQKLENETLGGLKFEGYNVYQLPFQGANLNDPGVVHIATFDIKDGIYTVYGWKYLNEFKRPMYVPLFIGSDSGIVRHFIVRKDYIHNKPLYQGSEYYFAVTSYNYYADGSGFPAYESEPGRVTIMMSDAKPGERYDQTKLEGELPVEATMESDVICKVVVVNPRQTTGHEYEVFFNQNVDTSSSNYGDWQWNLRDKTNGTLKLENMPIHIFSKGFEKIQEIIVDGLALYVQMPAAHWKGIVEVANRNGPLPESEWDSKGALYHGNNVWHDVSAASDLNRFYLSSSTKWGALGGIEQYIKNTNYHDFEMRFTEQGGIFTWWSNEGDVWERVPFEFWDIGYSHAQDTSNDVRCLTGGYSGGVTPGVFDFGYTDPFYGNPASDWIAIRKPLDEQGSYESYVHDVTSGELNKKWWEHSIPILENVIICDPFGRGTFPETGTIIRFITTKGPTDKLKFTFSSPQHTEGDLAKAKIDVQKVNVFPNPCYYDVNVGPNGPIREVTFTHLPQEAVIRIYTLNGWLVRKFVKDDGSQFLKWDLTNKKGQLVASGLYLVQVEMPEMKKKKVLKVMVVRGR